MTLLCVCGILLEPFILSGGEESEYLSSLRDGTFGCTTLAERKPNILFTGDSHTYAGWDYIEFKRNFTKSRSGGCALGGMYFETFIALLEQLIKTQQIPEVVIYSSSLRQFAEGKNKEAQITGHLDVIKEIQNPFWKFPDFKRSFEKLTTKLKKKIFVTKEISNADFQMNNTSQHKVLLESVPKDRAYQLMKTISNLSKRSWEEYIATAHINEDHYKKLIDKTCLLLKSHQIFFVMVDLPESPYLTSLYTDTQKKSYQNILQSLAQCSQIAINTEALKHSVTNLLFLNRGMRPDYPYEDLIQFDLAALSSYGPNLLYDLDHLNLVGANTLTQEISKILKKSKNIEKVPNAF